MTNIHSVRPALAGSLMVHTLAKNWWLILLRGIAAVIFGVLTFAWPGVTLLTLVLLYGAFALVDGALALVGLLGLVAGLITLALPGITAVILLYCIAFWAIAIGVMQVAGAIRLRKEIDNEWLLVASGVISVLFGLILIVAPGAGVLGLLFVIGVYAVIHGIMLIMLAMRLRRNA
jgi:uncharacterized membrane protein HdeD (DUF308 family)